MSILVQRLHEILSYSSFVVGVIIFMLAFATVLLNLVAGDAAIKYQDHDTKRITSTKP
jgi:Na+/alanine symporter